MKKVVKVCAVGICYLGALNSQSALADDDKDKAILAGAAVALGVAALAHNKHHHHNHKHSSNSNDEAQYERGYNDALYNSRYDTRNKSEAYSDGYDAGRYEREHRVNHNRNDERRNSRHDAPSLAQRACVGEASQQWDVNPRDIHSVKSKQAGGDDYYVEVASGYRHGKCEVSGEGEVYLLEDGRL